MILPAESLPHPALKEIPTLVDAIFRPGGYLQETLGLEHRPQQYRMALHCAQAFVEERPLLFEAGTGVGKSLAYLVPGLLFAIIFRRPMVVATHTIALQEQIQHNDLNLCRQLFDSRPELTPYRDIRTALLVGRRNYLCTPRLIHALHTKGELFPTPHQEALERIAEWSTQTETGLYEELHPPPPHEVWDWVNADSSLSNPKNPDCFYQKARARLRNAHLIIVNHALLFSLINAGAAPAKDASGVLFPGDFAVIDEAHRIPSIAAEHFGMTLSSAGLERTLKMLYNPKRKKGLLTRLSAGRDCAAVVQALAAAETFFNHCRETLLGKRATIRLHEPNWASPTLIAPLRALAQRLGSLAESLEGDTAREEVLDQRRRLNAAANTLEHCLALAEDDHVYWMEKSGKHGQLVHLQAAPIDVAPALRETLFERNTAAILTSATLAIGDAMERFQARIGALGEDTAIEHSPFDFENHLHIRIAQGMPNPSAHDKRLDTDFLAGQLRACIAETPEGGVLALFTSYQDMHACAALVEDFCADTYRPFFLQGRDAGRTELTRRFADAGNGVLFGTDSYWTGVDVPGPALSHLVITRLPFENPSHPILEARSEWLQRNGQNPFTAMTLPEAIIQFRQGIGRLIRKHDDTGTLTILDSRILTKPYGRQFLAALPKHHYERFL